MQFEAMPVKTEAIQFTGDNWEEVKAFSGRHQVDVDFYMDNFFPAEEMWPDVPEGIVGIIWVEPSKIWAGVRIGDYIVIDSEGFFYPCKKEIFEAKYRPVRAGSVITSDSVALKSIQQSSRFQ